MKSFKEDFIEMLKSSLSFPNVSVKDFYMVSTPSCPLVTVDEILSNDGIYISNQPRVIPVNLTIEVYCKQMKLYGKTVTGNYACRILASEIDGLMNNKCTFSLMGDAYFSPYQNDQSITRGVMRYTGFYDKINDKFYRKVV